MENASVDIDTISYGTMASVDIYDECPICLQCLEKLDTVTLHCCKKLLHASCYFMCLKNKKECPMCRNIIAFNTSTTSASQQVLTNNNEVVVDVRNDLEPQEPLPIVVLEANHNATKIVAYITFIFAMLFVCLYEISS